MLPATRWFLGAGAVFLIGGGGALILTHRGQFALAAMVGIPAAGAFVVAWIAAVVRFVQIGKRLNSGDIYE
jgi:hypothetical protein